MYSQQHPENSTGLSRRTLLKAGFMAGATLSAWPCYSPSALWGAEAGQPKRGGILRVRGYDPPHFDHHLTLNFKTNTTLSFAYSTLVRYQVGSDVRPGTFTVEPHLAEYWEQPDDTTYIFHLRQGVKWHNKPPLNGRELVADDVKFTYDRFLTEQGNPLRFILESVDRIEVVDRYTVKFVLKEPFVWLVLEDPSTGLAMYRARKIDCGPAPWWGVRQQDLEALKKSHPNLVCQDFLSNVTGSVIYLRTDMPPFNDVRIRRAISMAIDRQGIIDGVYIRGEPTPAIARGATEWSLPIGQLGEGARHYQYDPKEARRLLAEAGFAKGFKTQLNTTGGYGPDLLDAVQLVQRYLKDVDIEVEMKIQEYGAYMATTFLGKFEGMSMGPVSITWEPDSVLYGMYAPDQPRNSGHVNDPKLTAMLKEQRRTQDLEARKKLIFDIQRYVAMQQYYVYTNSIMITGTWQPYVKNYTPNPSFDYGGRAAALWLER